MAGGSATHGIVALLAVIDRAAAIKQLMILWWCIWHLYIYSMVIVCMMASVDLGRKDDRSIVAASWRPRTCN
jgi:hypothetical protein